MKTGKYHLYYISALLLCTLSLKSQTSLNQLITKNYTNYDARSILQDIGLSYKISFFYKESDLPSRKASYSFKDQELSQVLSNIFEGTSLAFTDYRYYGVIIAPSDYIEANFTAEYYIAMEDGMTDQSQEEAGGLNIGDTNNIAASGHATLTGKIYDATDQHSIVGATILVQDEYVGALTDHNGSFSLTLTIGRHILLIQSVGYQDLQQMITVFNAGSISLTLEKAPINLKEVVISARSSDNNITNAQVGLTQLDIASIKKLPTFLGETDIVKALLLQPGVSTVGEGAIGFNVRGGNVDQNLIMQNEAIIYNASHALGFFSTFNADLIKNVTLYKGNIPAQFGGRLASVLEVDHRDGDFHSFKLRSGIGPVSGRLSLEGPLVKGKTSFLFGARSSYSDWILNRIKVPEIQRSAVSFYDVNLNITHKFDEKNSLILSSYIADDSFVFNQEFGFDYQTTLTQITYKKIISQKLFSNLSVTASHYKSSQTELSNTLSSKLKNSITYYKLKELLTYVPNEQLKIVGGFSTIYQQVEPGDLTPHGSQSQVIPQSLDQEQALESALFANTEWNMSNNLLSTFGLRLSQYYSLGPGQVSEYIDEAKPTVESIVGSTSYNSGEKIASYSSLEPRIGLRYKLNKQESIKAGYSRTTQYINQIFNTNAATPSSQFQLSNRYIKPKRAHNMSVGYYKNLRENIWETSISTYYRYTDLLYDYIDFADLIVNNNLETQLTPGIGRTVGLELSIKKNVGKLNGWLSYTLSKSELQVVNVNGGKWYLSNLDKPHDFSVVLNFQPNKRNTFTINFNYANGRPITAPTASYVEVNGLVVPVYSDRNQLRIPDYHRLDIAFTKGKGHKKNKKFKTSWTFSIYNVYGRRNAFSVFYSQEPFKNPKANRLSILGNAFPSVTFNIESM